MPSRWAAATKRSKSSIVPNWGSMAVCPPAGPPIAQGLPGSPGAAASALSRPFRLAMPTGWMGGRYTTSKPNSATRASARSASANVPCRAASPLCERGNISYHDAKRARSRSTQTRSSRSCDVRSSGARCCAMSASSLGSSASRARSCHAAEAYLSREAHCASSRRVSPKRTQCVAVSTNWAPSSRSSDTSWPASIFFSSWARQVPKRSVQASTVNVQLPIASSAMPPVQRSEL